MGTESQTLTENPIQAENQTLTETRTNRVKVRETDRNKINRTLAINPTKTAVEKIEAEEEMSLQ